MKKLILGGLGVVILSSVIKANQANELQTCLTKCETAKSICHTQATLTLARVNACGAVDDNFGVNYNCAPICHQNSRTIRFDSVK